MPKLHLSTYDTEDPVAVGSNTTDVVEVRNQGPPPVTMVKMDFSISDEMKFISAKTNAGLTYTVEGDTV